MSGPLKRILIADRHIATRTGVRGLLAANPNWKVVAEAATSDEALALAEQWRPDVAVVACSLTPTGGAELERAIRAASHRTEVLIYALSAQEELIVQAVWLAHAVMRSSRIALSTWSDRLKRLAGAGSLSAIDSRLR
jgi:DNA-binding NarL/FixJ family response regulator